MRRPILTTAATIAALAVLPGTAHAQDDATFAGDLSVGTTGVSANAQLGLHPRLALRMGYNWLEVSRDDEEISGVSYSGDLEFAGFGGFVDAHPFANPFTVTGGVFVGDKSAVLDAVPTEDVTLGDQTFTPDQVGVIDGSAEFGDTALFAGIGYDPSLYKPGGLSFVVRAGVMFAGEPDVTLSATAETDERIPEEARAELTAALRAEEAILEDDIDDYAFFPVLTVGLSYGF